MLVDDLKKNTLFFDEALSWEDAVKKSAQPLLANGDIRESYVDAIIENVKVNGSYIVVVPGVAIPHARHEKGAIRKAVGCAVFEKPVIFPDDKVVHVLITLSSDGDDGHLEMLSELAVVLMEDEPVEKLKHAKTVEDVLNVFR